MKLQKLIVIRHAPYEFRGFVTAEGQELIKRLAAKLKASHEFKPKTTVMLCSHELRALKTLQSLQQALGLEGDRERVHKELFSSSMNCYPKEALHIITPYCEVFETVIVVTHLEMTPLLARICGAEILGINGFFTAQGDYLQGYLLDYKGKTCVPIEP